MENTFAALLPIGVFGLVIWAYWKKIQNLWMRKPLKWKYPNQPWRWRKDWNLGYAQPENTDKFLISLFLGMITLSIPFIVKIKIELGFNLPTLVYIVMFPVGALAFFHASVKQWRQVTKLGDQRFFFKSFGVLGKELTGQIVLTRSAPISNNFKIRLIQVYFYNNNFYSVARSKIHWEGEFETESIKHGSLVSIPISLVIPAHLPPTSDFEAGTFDVWKLQITSKEPRFTYQVMYEIPVLDPVDAEKVIASSPGSEPASFSQRIPERRPLGTFTKILFISLAIAGVGWLIFVLFIGKILMSHKSW